MLPSTPNPTYNDINTKDWYQSLIVDENNPKVKIPKIYKLEEEGYDGLVNEPTEAPSKVIEDIKKSNEWENRIPVGIFYENNTVPTYEERLQTRIENYEAYSPAEQIIMDIEGNPNVNINELIDELKANGPQDS